jgi:hypothetical protein
LSIAFNQLSQILALAGSLDDSAGSNTARQRFRDFLDENVTEVGQVRDYVQECLKASDAQYSRALQDLINHIGRRFLGFEVTFGRYQGVKGQIGFDGHWMSPSGFHIVVEVKTSEIYPIKTATLVGYVNELIGEKKISDWDTALGLYVVGTPNREVQQLENSIVAEKRTHQLRIISADSLLSLAELMNGYDVEHENVLALLRPTSPTVDPVVSLISRLVAQQTSEPTSSNGGVEQTIQSVEPIEQQRVSTDDVAYWLTPVKGDKDQSAEDVLQTLLGQEGIYAFGERTPRRKELKAGDRMCFYAAGKGVVAHATVGSAPQKQRHPKVRHSDKYPWVFKVDDVELYLDEPIAVDAEMRSRLDAFKNRDLNKAWAWFVQATRILEQQDFQTLIGQKSHA